MQNKYKILIIAIAIIIIIVGLAFLQSFFNRDTKTQTNLTNDKIIGVWQDSPVMASGWADHYQFFASGKYNFRRNNMDCFDLRQSASSGYWKIEGDKILLTPIIDISYFGEEISPGLGSTCALFTRQESIHSGLASTGIQPFSCSSDESESASYPCFRFGGVAYYRFSTDPTYNNDSSLEQEPVLNNQIIGWKTYTNIQYGFEFSYPTKAMTILDKPEVYNTYCNISEEKDICDVFTSGVIVTVVNRDLDEKSIHKYDRLPLIGKLTNVIEEITVGGKIAYKYNLISSLSYKITGFMVPLDDNYFIEVSENDKMPKLNMEDWSRIVSTFKFIK